MLDLSPIYTEIFLMAMIYIIGAVDLFSSNKDSKTVYALTQVALLGSIVIASARFGQDSQVIFNGHFVSDNMAILLKIAIAFVSMIALLYARDYINRRQFMRTEYYLLALYAVLGMMVLVSAHSLLTIYLGLEMLALPSYALVAMRRDSRSSSEAGIKYFVMGAIASGFILYGISILYGVTGEIDIARISESVANHLENSDNKLLLSFSLVFIISGLAFKLGAVPFHMWIPDIYHGAPTPVVAFIGSVPKIAAFGMLMRILVEAIPQLSQDWQQLLIILCVLSIAIGNISAVVQTNLKRMLAYSAIAHIGYFLLGIIAGTPEGYAASMFYIIVYALMTVAGFGIIIFLSKEGFEGEEIADFKGLWKHNPWYGLVMLVIMMSMAGVPPFIGFWPKLEVIAAILNSGAGYGIWLAVTAVFFSIIGAYYYLMVCKSVFFDEPDREHVIDSPRDLRIALSLNGALLLVLGLFPASLLTYCLNVFL